MAESLSRVPSGKLLGKCEKFVCMHAMQTYLHPSNFSAPKDSNFYDQAWL